jgi:hypothetical protein
MNLRSYFAGHRERRANADEIGVSATCGNPSPSTISERKRAETTESERKTTEKTADDSPPVREPWWQRKRDLDDEKGAR